MRPTAVFNVVVPVVELVRAESEADADARLRAALRRAGFEPYDGEGASSFESEEVPDAAVRDLPPVEARA